MFSDLTVKTADILAKHSTDKDETRASLTIWSQASGGLESEGNLDVLIAGLTNIHRTDLVKEIKKYLSRREAGESQLYIL